jgi:hypothetical protein
MDLPEATPADERRHQPDDDELWNESYYLDFFAADGSLGGYLRIGLYPNLGQSWYWACVVGPDRPLVTVIDNAAPLPPPGESLEIRADGLWCDHHVGTPLEHFTVGLEAFGIALDDPADVYRGTYGDRNPIAFDLEWETDGNVFRYPDLLPRYEIPCRVHGEIRVGPEEIAFDGFGQRDHSWGRRDWWSMGWCWTAFRMEDGARFHAVTPKPDQGWGFGYDQEPVAGATSGPPLETLAIDSFDADEVLGSDGIPIAARLTMGERVFDVEPIAWSPVLLTAPDQREARFPRGMCTFTEVGGAHAGRTGKGWIEFNQPPAPA